jgi:hypothetical protein
MTVGVSLEGPSVQTIFARGGSGAGGVRDAGCDAETPGRSEGGVGNTLAKVNARPGVATRSRAERAARPTLALMEAAFVTTVTPLATIVTSVTIALTGDGGRSS